jgi:DNA-binding transcriptional LysR family regulator
MEIKWVEDFLSVVDTLNFSRSAKLRNVTQPAFGRRIRSLETWLGAELFDRSSYPCTLTPAVNPSSPSPRRCQPVHAGQAGAARPAGRGAILGTLCDAAHALADGVPQAAVGNRKTIGAIATTVMAGNVHDAVMALVERNCDLLLCYDHRQQGIALDTERYAVLSLGKEPLRPTSRRCLAASPSTCCRARPTIRNLSSVIPRIPRSRASSRRPCIPARAACTCSAASRPTWPKA